MKNTEEIKDLTIDASTVVDACKYSLGTNATASEFAERLGVAYLLLKAFKVYGILEAHPPQLDNVYEENGKLKKLLRSFIDRSKGVEKCDEVSLRVYLKSVWTDSYMILKQLGEDV